MICLLISTTVHLEDIHGMPVGLQVMCPRLQEEQTLALVDAISDAMERYRTRV